MNRRTKKEEEGGKRGVGGRRGGVGRRPGRVDFR